MDQECRDSCPALDAEEARSDNMGEAEILVNAEKMIPANQGVYTMMETPLAKEALAGESGGSGDDYADAFPDDDDL